MPSADVLEATRRYLNSHNIFVTDTWLAEGLEYFQENLSERNINTIQSNIKEQYYLNDLRDTSRGSLPKNLNLKKEIVLPNKYILQIDSIIDIGKPAYQQYMELQKVDLDDIEATKTYEEKVPTCRMLKLNMTDGEQDVVGIEYRTIRSLNANISPGFKILIKGPVIYRNGFLLLEDKNCQPLDGEVDVLMQNNSQKMMLEQRLRLFDSDKLRSIMTSSITQPLNTEKVSTSTSVTQATVPSTSRIQQDSSRNTSELFSTSSICQEQTTLVSAPFISKAGPSGTMRERKKSWEGSLRGEIDEDIDMDIVDPQQLDEIEAQFKQALDKSDDIEMPPEKKMKTDEFSDECIIIDENDMICATDVVNIRDINGMGDKACKTFEVKARIVNILSKLSVTKVCWKLSCSLSDGTDNIDVGFSNGVLERVIGYTPQQMKQLKNQIKTQPELVEKGNMIISEAKEKFKKLNCRMKIEFTSDSEMPTVTDLIDYC